MSVGNFQGREMMIENRNYYGGGYDDVCDRCHSHGECSCYKKPKKWNALDPTEDHPFACSVDPEEDDN